MNQKLASEINQSRGEVATSLNTPEHDSTPEAVQLELERVLSSPLFTRSTRLSRFLRFIVERTLRNEGDSLKEYALAMEVFDRGESYEPGVDTLVRVEAGRLRNKLREYYESEGRDSVIFPALPQAGAVRLRDLGTTNALVAVKYGPSTAETPMIRPASEAAPQQNQFN